MMYVDFICNLDGFLIYQQTWHNPLTPEITNTTQRTLVSAARAHTEVHIVLSFIDQISALEEGPTRDVLSRLLSLFALTTIVSPSANNAISFVEDGYLSHEQLGNIREHINGLLDVLVPDAIALIDAWNFTDASLASEIGCKDGNAVSVLCSGPDSCRLMSTRRRTGVCLLRYMRSISSRS
jgi:acyl-CoA oxidase